MLVCLCLLHLLQAAAVVMEALAWHSASVAAICHAVDPAHSLCLQLLCQLLLLVGELSSDSPLLLRLQAADAVKETMTPTKPLEDIPDIDQLQTSGSSATGWWKIEQPPNTICHRSTSCEK